MIAARTAAVAALLMAMAGPSPPEPRSASTIAMARRLSDLAASADPLRNPILNQQRAALLRRKFADEPSTEVGFGAIRELLRAGETADALEIAGTLEYALDRVRVPDRDALLTIVRELTALAYLRDAEQRNCLSMHNAESCLLPIVGRGVHQMKGSALEAARIYETLLEQSDRPSYRWLLNLAHMSAGDYPAGVPARWRIPAERFASQAPFARFMDVAASSGVAMVGGAGGAVLDDFDGDGDLDLVASRWQLNDQLRYYRNDGRGRFTDRTAEAGILGETGGINVIQADFDNDGDVDVMVLRGGWLFDQGRQPSSLLANRGDGTFDDVTEKAGLLGFHPTQSAAFADYDGDGWLDLYVGHESTAGDPHPCELFHNNHDGTFTEVGAAAGVATVGFVKGVAWGDYDNDGRPDLYLSRYGQPNVLYRNDGAQPGGWKFTDVTARAGVAEPINSFPCWFWDFDNDGWLDLFVASFTGFTAESLDLLAGPYVGRPGTEPHSRLYRNNRDGTFSDVTRAVGLDTPLAVMGANFGDFDNDGLPDIYLGTGEPSLATLVPNRMFRNDRGLRFQDVTTAAGVGHLQKGHAIAVGDVDGDGDQDLYCVMGGSYVGDVYPNALFRNPGNQHRWIVLKVRGTHENRLATGARVAVTVDTASGTRVVHRTIGVGSSFGTTTLQQQIGLGTALRVRDVTIRWPASGRLEHFDGLALDRAFTLTEGRGRPER
jgi:hypothetical protein